MTIKTKSEDEINIEYVYPPIPNINPYYIAYRDQEGFIGQGPTEEQAKEDLIFLESQ